MKKLLPFLFIFFVACTGDKVLINSSDIKSKTKMIDFIADETKQDYPQTTKNMEKIKLITPEVNKDADNLYKENASLKKSLQKLNSKHNQMVKYIILGGLSLTGLGFLVFGIARGGKDNTFIGGICCIISIGLGLYWDWVGRFGIIIFVFLVVSGIVIWWEGKGNKKEVFKNYG